MNAAKSPFSIRSLCIGSVMSLFIGIASPYAMIMVQSASWGAHAAQLGGVFLFFVFTFIINTILGLIRRPMALDRSELVIIYVMMLVALTVPTQNLLVYIIPVICVPFYSASAENNWDSLIHPNLPGWFAPQDYNSIRELYEGLSAGQTIPWEAWLTPFIAWFSFFIALSIMMFCLSGILHRQWSMNERLAYPMVQLPQQMIELGENPLARVAPFLKNPLVWIGFAVPFILHSSTALHYHYPAVPAWNYTLGSFSLFEGLHRVPLTLSFAWLGFFFQVETGILFSVWFFYLFSKLEDGLLTVSGIAGSEVMSQYEGYNTPDLGHQGVGAVLVFVLCGLWVARGHLRLVWEKTWHPRKGTDGDAEELLPYRGLLCGFLGSIVFLAVWLWHSGVPVAALPLFLLMVLVYYVMITRVTTAGGIPSARPPIVAPYVVISGMGASLLGTKGLVAMGIAMGWQAEMRLFPMIACANGLKLAEMVPGSKSRLFWGMLLAVVCSLVAGTWILMTLGYEHGGVNLGGPFLSNGNNWHFLTPLLHSQPEANLRGWVFTGIGAAVEGFLMWANHRWFWWPLHPLGFVVCVGFLTGHIWFSAFVAWLLKVNILKYGGASLFTRIKPLFLGLILGEATCAGIWLAIDYATGTVGNRLSFA